LLESTLTPRSEKGVALAALILGAVLIAFAPIFVRLSETGPVATAFWRLTLALPALWAWAWLARDGDGSASAPRYGTLALAGLFFAGDLAVWHWSIRLTTVANSTLLANLAPIFVTLGAWLLYRERVSRLFLAGMVIALLGVMLLIRGTFATTASRLLGDGLGVITAVFYGAYMLAVKQLRGTVSTARVMASSGIVTSLALLPIALLSGERMLPVTLAGWATLAGLALVAQAAGQSLIAYAMAHLSAPMSSVSLLVQPMMATLYAWALFGETIAPLQMAGAVAVLAGIYLARRGSG
jgi:drug/metabolite transporter (DMT)-like permease